MSVVSINNTDLQKLLFFRGRVPMYYWILCAITGVITLLCNGVVIFIILRRERLYRNATNWLLLSLAFSDLSVGIIMIPSLFICYFSTIVCDWGVNKKIYDLFLYVSVTNLCFLTLDRYIAVVFPLKYALLVPEKLTIKLLMTAWLFPIFTFLIPFLLESLPIADSKKQDAVKIHAAIKVGIFELIPCLVMLLAYMHIFLISRRHARHINSINKSIKRERNSNNEKNLRARSAVKVFCIVVPLFVVCWTIASWREICSVFHACSVPPTTVHVSRLLLKGHSMIDPIVYALHKRDIRKELIKRSGLSRLMAFHLGPKRTRSDCSYTISFEMDQTRKEKSPGIYRPFSRD